jgi:Tfp pilus assembly protein PilF
MRRALAIDEASFGPEHPDVARDLNNLAALLADTNSLGEAEPLYRRALAIDDGRIPRASQYALEKLSPWDFSGREETFQISA